MLDNRESIRQLSREAYEQRDELLRLLDFKSYGSYLRSPLWRIIRERAFAINGQKCKRCSNAASQIHHADYSRQVLTGEDVRALVPVCGGCHKAGSLTLHRSHERKIGARLRTPGDTNAFLARRKKPTNPNKQKCRRCRDCGRPVTKKQKRCHDCKQRAVRRRMSPKIKYGAVGTRMDLRPRLSTETARFKS